MGLDGGLVNLPDAAIEVLARAEQMAPSGCQAVIMCQRLGGKIDTPEGGVESCAYAHRGGGFWLVLQVVTSKVGKHEDPQKAALADAWLTNTCKELEPHVIEKGVGCISPATTPVAGTRTQGAGAAVMFPPVNVFGDAATGWRSCARSRPSTTRPTSSRRWRMDSPARTTSNPTACE